MKRIISILVLLLGLVLFPFNNVFADGERVSVSCPNKA